MNTKQQKLVDETVNNYHGMDKLKESGKLAIDEMFISMAEHVGKNYNDFEKDPELVMAEFIDNYMNENLELIKKATVLGMELGEAINET